MHACYPFLIVMGLRLVAHRAAGAPLKITGLSGFVFQDYSVREIIWSSSLSTSGQQIDVSFECVCPVIDHWFRHHIAKVAMDRRVDPADYFDNVMTKFMINNRTDALKTDIDLFFTITNCRIASSRSLTRRMNFKFMCLSTYWQQKLANERAWISAVIVKTSFLTKCVWPYTYFETESIWFENHFLRKRIKKN